MKIEEFLKNFETTFREQINNDPTLSLGQRAGCNKSILTLMAVLKEKTRLVHGVDVSQKHIIEYEKAINDSGKLGWQDPKGITGMAANHAHKVLKDLGSLALQKGYADEERKDAADVPPKVQRTHKSDPRLLAIFQETKRICEQGFFLKGVKRYNFDRDQVAQSTIAETAAYRSMLNGSLKQLSGVAKGGGDRISRPSKQSTVHSPTATVLNTDSFRAAKTLIDQGFNPLVLNMANKTSIGGGVENGSRAQEEDLFRCSNYYQALYTQGKPSINGRHIYNHTVGEFGCVYTPDVCVFRDGQNGYAFLDDPFNVSCIAVAGYDLGKADFRRELAGTALLKEIDAGTPILDAFEQYTREKIKLILEMAILKGHDSLVLGALSCGAFRYRDPKTGEQEDDGITANRVAKAFETVLKMPEYKNCFKNITFAILAPNAAGQKNLDIFNNMVNRLGVPFNVVDSVNAAAVHPASGDVERKEYQETQDQRELREALATIALQEEQEKNASPVRFHIGPAQQPSAQQLQQEADATFARARQLQEEADAAFARQLEEEERRGGPRR